MTDQSRPPPREGQRIAKAMARAGLCSRRDAEAWIAAGRVSVNGEVLTSPAFNVSGADDVRVDGQRLGAPERTRLFLFHKPRGLVTTARDPEGRSTIFDALPPDLPRLVAVGRLDINTEGLLLLTNDGGLARVLELPATGWLRRYRVRAHGTVDQPALDALKAGVTLEGVHYAGIDAHLDRQQGANVWITMGLREGKNREIKRVLEHLSLVVNRLIRVSFGPFELGDLAEGEVAEVRTRVLSDQLGPKLAREAGVNFDAPVIARGEPPAPAAPKRESGGGGERPRRGAPSGRFADKGGRREEDAAPARRQPPRPSTPHRQRKHVSALRAEAAVEALGPRKRLERGATQDRKGRAVAVERMTVTGEERLRRDEAAVKKAARARGKPRFGGGGRDGVGEASMARRPHASLAGGEARPFRARSAFVGKPARTGAPARAGDRPRRDAERPARPPRGEKPAASAERPQRDARDDARRERRFGEGPRRERDDRPPRGEGRPPRAERSEQGPRRGPPRAEGRFAGAPRARSFADRPQHGAGEGPPRGEGRPARTERGERGPRKGPPRGPTGHAGRGAGRRPGGEAGAPRRPPRKP